jgi:hypothetical protein
MTLELEKGCFLPPLRFAFASLRLIFSKDLSFSKLYLLDYKLLNVATSYFLEIPSIPVHLRIQRKGANSAKAKNYSQHSLEG